MASTTSSSSLQEGEGRTPNPALSPLGRGGLLAEQEPAEERAVSRDDPVARLDKPDERRQCENSREPRASDLPEDEQTGPTRGEQRAVRGEDVDGPGTARREGVGHRRARRRLIGHHLEEMLPVSPLDPSGRPPSEPSVAVPEEPVLHASTPSECRRHTRHSLARRPSLPHATARMKRC